MWGDIPTSAAQLSATRDKNRGQRSSPDPSETNRKSPPADDPARNNLRSFWVAHASVLVAASRRNGLPKIHLVASPRLPNHQSPPQTRRRSFANETPDQNQASSRDRNQAREFS